MRDRLCHNFFFAQTHLDQLEETAAENKDVLFRSESLAKTLNDHDIPVLTITSNVDNAVPAISDRSIVILTSRVHPGETNASWIMKGLLDFLVGASSEASELRSRFLFKIVPMLNVEGVINGW